jgi:hypothetical protein
MAMPNKWLHDEVKLFNFEEVETGFTILVI